MILPAAVRLWRLERVMPLLSVCTLVLASCARGATPAPSPTAVSIATTTMEATPAAIERLAVLDQNVNARIERVENGLIEVTTNGEPLWDFPRTLLERMKLYGVPGASIAVIDDYHVEWARGYGVLEADLKVDSEQAVSPETLFHAGSIAKTLSAAAALTLVEQGQLDLDQNVNEKLVSWQVPESAYTQNEKVTLRRLLSHSAGLTDGFTETGIECCYSAEGEAPTVSIQQMLEADPVTGLPRPARVTQTPGEQYRYSNLGYGIVQLLVDDTTQVPFAQFMQKTVLDPLGMTSSTFEQPLPEALRARASTEHDADSQPFVGLRHHFRILASGGLWTTPSDLARFAIEIMRAYLGESDKLLSQEMARQMLTAQVPIDNGGLATGSGLGFELSGAGEIATVSRVPLGTLETTASRHQLGEALSIQHGGGTWGSTCFLIAFPETGQGAVMMTNSRKGGSLLLEILVSIAVEYGWPLVQGEAGSR
jgi:CubicO group peptidase (beta-lactamase class C family)